MKARRVLAIFMAIAMVLCYIPTMGFAGVSADATEIIVDETQIPVGVEDTANAPENPLVDMPKEGFWSTAALKSAVTNGLLKGFTEADGTYIRPNDPLTRVQMATIVNRAFGATVPAALSGVDDVSGNAWYYGDLQKAVQMGTMKLDNKMRPNSSITREEAFTVLARALKMNDGTKADLEKFSDASKVATWATSGMGAMVKAGYIMGDNNLLNPTAEMTRAQFAVIMNNVIKEYITASGTVAKVASGNVMVNVSGVTLKNLTITGDLIIGDGVGEGEAVLDGVKVEGKVIVRGGGVNSIIIRGNSKIGTMILAKTAGNIRVIAEKDANIEIIYVDDGSQDVTFKGFTELLELVGDNITVNVELAMKGHTLITGKNSFIIFGEIIVGDTVIPAGGGSGGNSGGGDNGGGNPPIPPTPDELHLIFISDSGVITGYKEGISQKLEIPKHLRVDGVNVTVVAIDYGAFASCAALTSIVIPDSVKSITTGAFYYCTSLSSITLGTGLTEIGDSAFHGCGALTSITIPDSVNSLGTNVFYGCTSLSNIALGGGLTEITFGAFQYCKKLESITIPDSMKSIGENAFYECTSLSAINLGSGLINIHKDCFAHCGNLAKIEIPDSVRFIGESAFSNCEKLSVIMLGEGVFLEGEIFSDPRGTFKTTYDLDKSKGTYTFVGTTWSK